MSGVDFKSFMIGILIAIIFVFTTGVASKSGGKYMVSCGNGCYVLNTETGAGKYVKSAFTGSDIHPPGVKADF